MPRKRIVISQNYLDQINESRAQKAVDKAESGGFFRGMGIMLVVTGVFGGVLVNINLGGLVFLGGLFFLFDWLSGLSNSKF